MGEVERIDEAFVFLGQRFIRRPNGHKRHVYTLVCDEALASIKRKIKDLTGRSTRNLALADPLRVLNPVLRGWAGYFRYAAAKRTFSYLGDYAWRRVVGGLRQKHPQRSWKQIRRRYFGKDRLQENGIELYNPASLRVERYRYRGAQISTPWNEATVDPRPARATGAPATGTTSSSNESSRRSHDQPPTRCVHGEPDAGELARPVRRAAARKPPAARLNRRLAADPTHPVRPPTREPMFMLVSRRYERASPIVTSNKPFSAWGEIFGDDVTAAATMPPATPTGSRARARAKSRAQSSVRTATTTTST